MACRLIFVRHGQSLGNKVRSFLGHTNLDLSELGYAQAELTGKYLKERKIDAIYSMVFQDEKELPINLNQEVDDSVFNLSEGVTTNEIVEENSIN